MFKDFSPSKLSQPQNVNILETFKDFFACKIVLAAKHEYTGNIQRLFPLQEMSWPQIINILEKLKDLFACKFVLAANRHYPGNVQRLFAFKIVSAAKHQYPGNIQRLSRLHNCLSSQSSKSWKYSKTFSPAKMS